MLVTTSSFSALRDATVERTISVSHERTQRTSAGTGSPIQQETYRHRKPKFGRMCLEFLGLDFGNMPIERAVAVLLFTSW
jgi:hypothetical protein